jgi:isopentenyl-diphosphate delta-isomerase
LEDRKKDHIELALEAQTLLNDIDDRFYYEPMLSAHPVHRDEAFTFLGKTFRAPIWVSSMTGGTELAGTINLNLARACKEFGLGMGLGSCRIILDDDTYFADFDMRDTIGDDQALFANLGIGQVEQLLSAGRLQKVHDLVSRLRADGLIIHVNPLQEWVQPEGDRFSLPPAHTIERFLEHARYKVIVKEVGQGIGPESLGKLLELPIAAIEFGAFGGANFSKVEMLRNADPEKRDAFAPLTRVGADARTMVGYINEIVAKTTSTKCPEVIISGGIKTFLDGYYLVKKSKLPAIYGQASAFLSVARGEYETLRDFVENQVSGYNLAEAYLRIKE